MLSLMLATGRKLVFGRGNSPPELQRTYHIPHTTHNIFIITGGKYNESKC